MGVEEIITLNFTIQLLLGTMVPPENDMEDAPAAGLNVAVVPQPDVVALAGLATTISPGASGKLSVKLTPSIVPSVGLLIVKVRTEEPPALTGSSEKFLAMVMLFGSTIAANRKDVLKSEL